MTENEQVEQPERPLETRWRERWGDEAPVLEYSSGWDAIVEQLDTAILALDPGYRVSQVKTKFGELTFYTDLSLEIQPDTAERIYALVLAAERESRSVCESCGRPGKIRSIGGWLSTMCDESFDAWHKADTAVEGSPM